MYSCLSRVSTEYTKNRKGANSLSSQNKHCLDKNKNKKTVRGSVTLETALVLPLFMFAILSMAFIMEIVRLQIHIGTSASQISKGVSRLCYAEGILLDDYDPRDTESENRKTLVSDLMGKVASETFIRGKVIDMAGKEYLDNSILSNGSASLHLYRSRIMEDRKFNDIVVDYKVDLPFKIVPLPEISLSQRFKTRAWIGYYEDDEDVEDDEDIVFVTRNGTKYHLYRDCKYLFIKSRKVKGEDVENERNANGGKYRPCSRCNCDKSGDVYITEYGTKYHNSPKCTAIYREVFEKKLSEVEGMGCCSECEKRQE